MATRYNLEKILYFGERGLHVSPYEEQANTTLHNLTKQALNAGFLETRERHPAGHEGGYYHLTQKGQVVLAGLQLGFRLNHNKEAGNATSRLQQALIGLNEPELMLGMQSLLNEASKGKFDTKLYRKSDRYDQAASSMIMAMNGIEVDKPLGKRGLTALGQQLKTAVSSVIMSRGIRAEATTEPVKLNTPTPREALSQGTLVSVPTEQDMSQKQAQVKLMNGLFRDGPHSEYHDAPTPGVDDLVNAGLITLVDEDDAANYYKLNHVGHALMKEVEMAHLTAMNLPTDRLISDQYEALSAPHDPNMDFGAYVKQGEALARERLSQEAFGGLNDLHWDEAYNDGLSPEEACQQLVDNEKRLALNSPASREAGHMRVLASLDALADDYGSKTELSQRLPEIRTRLEAELGTTVEPEIMDHALSHYERATPSPKLSR